MWTEHSQGCRKRENKHPTQFRLCMLYMYNPKSVETLFFQHAATAIANWIDYLLRWT